ncbi:hypothetical protein MHBO_000739 [Bonamia ostreae]|uniref:BPL/LPL catalytic domain-containing protein n=1 Tax=Bonamia ostreae TaxID=126728 RepID=A0ABV2AGP4_9EUKA
MAIFLLKSVKTNLLNSLRIQEMLMRHSIHNFIIINSGINTKNIVMGLADSKNPEKLISLRNARESGINLYKRFSGGGTVFVDENTFFVTFIFNKSGFLKTKPEICDPSEILHWTFPFYKKVFEFPDFAINGSDYSFGARKFGGSAQMISGRRFVHHTSFLWDFDLVKMDGILKIPKKQPQYRKDRTHKEFLIALKNRFNGKNEILSKIESVALSHDFGEKVDTKIISLDEDRICKSIDDTDDKNLLKIGDFDIFIKKKPKFLSRKIKF